MLLIPAFLFNVENRTKNKRMERNILLFRGGKWFTVPPGVWGRAMPPPVVWCVLSYSVLSYQISVLRREEEAFTDPARRQKVRPRTTPAKDGSETPEVIVGDLPGEDDEDWEPRGSGSRQRPGGGSPPAAKRDDDNYACAALLKYRRVASFMTASGRSTPEDMVSWLDARLMDKNIAPLYRTGLRPEHVPSIVEEILLQGGGEESLGGLDEATVSMIVVAEATRWGSGGSAQAEAERVKEVEVMPPKTGPWQKR